MFLDMETLYDIVFNQKKANSKNDIYNMAQFLKRW